MGQRIKAYCKCGFGSNIKIGGGRIDFKTTNYFPCYCENCVQLIEVNLKKDPLTCPNCNDGNILPYNHSQLIGENGDYIIARTFEMSITNGYYYCPKCESFSLQFQSGGLFWD